VIWGVGVAGFIIGFNKAGAASTLGPINTVLLAMLLPADQAVGLLLPMLIVADAFSVAAHWGKWNGAVMRPLLASAVVGIAVGSVTISVVDEEVLRRLIAISSLVFVALVVWTRFRKRTMVVRRAAAWTAGAASGLTSTIAHAGGPPVIAYLTALGMEPATFVGTTVVFFAIVNLLKVPAYVAAGIIPVDLILDTLWAWLAIPVGVGVGRLVIRHINPRLFDRAVLALLVIGAVVLLVQ